MPQKNPEVSKPSVTISTESPSATPRVLRKKRVLGAPIALTTNTAGIPPAVSTSASALGAGIASATLPVTASSTPAGIVSSLTTLPSAASSAPSATAVPAAADMPPTAVAPAVPPGFAPTPLDQFRGTLPNLIELRALPGAANDLERFVDYATVLSGSATPAKKVISAIRLGLAWRQQRTTAEQWATYAKIEDAIAWASAMPMVDEVKTLFLFAVSKNPELASEYPSLAQLFGTSKVIAKQAAKTKAKNAKAAKAAKAGAATQAAATPAPVASPATPEATPTKTITVNT